MKKPTNVYVDNAGKKGRGVFASKDLKKGTIIEISPFIEIPESDYSLIENTVLNFYWYEGGESSCAIGLGYTSLYNHSNKANSEFIVSPEDKTITIVVLKSIKKGQEVLIDYGYDIESYFKKK